MKMIKTIQKWARVIKRDAVMLWFARKHPDTPLLAKILCVMTLLYALSPIDLIPDFIPVLGFVDDAILLPLLIWLAIKILPLQVRTSCRLQADQWMSLGGGKPKSYVGAALIVALWCVVIYLIWRSSSI
tara:strand:+ start:87816 stop:88202 length:387 start_codon:yes stop_codon:yes gene_type:complete